MTRAIACVAGLLTVLVAQQPAHAEHWRSGDAITLRWACPNIRGAQRAHAYFSRGLVSDRDAEAYLRRSGCYVDGLSGRLDEPMLTRLETYDGQPATIWRLRAKERIWYGVVLDATGPHARMSVPTSEAL